MSKFLQYRHFLLNDFILKFYRFVFIFLFCQILTSIENVFILSGSALALTVGKQVLGIFA